MKYNYLGFLISIFYVIDLCFQVKHKISQYVGKWFPSFCLSSLQPQSGTQGSKTGVLDTNPRNFCVVSLLPDESEHIYLFLS